MTWLRKDYWLPDGNPHVIVARKHRWPAIRSEIEDLQPDYPVKLVVPAVAAVHGRRVRSFQLRIEPGDTTSVWGEVDAELRRCVLKSGGAL